MKSSLLKISFILLLLSIFSIGWVAYTYYQPGPLKEPVRVILPKGASLFKISHILGKQNVIQYPRIFALILVATGKRTHIQAGEYEFAPFLTPAAVVDKLTKGQVYLYKLTFPEGITSYQIREILKAQDYLISDTDRLPPEGMLFPETYAVPRGTPYSKIYALMEEKMVEFMAKAWKERALNLPFASTYEALILASIVEKETSLSQEKPHVAAVFINRLKRGMFLQADPTIVYNLTCGKGIYGKKLLATDLKKTLPHNTYLYKGLPPTPIAMPGKEAILAVLNPRVIDDIYFVADGNGGHKFSNNLKTHIQYVLAYRQKLRKK